MSHIGIAFIKEWHDRQSPTIIYGGSLSGAGVPESWKMTDGKCEHISVPMLPTTAGHPLTSKTLSFREAYFDKWEEIPDGHGTSSYDCIRFVLFDAIKRAGTIETNSLINALEKTSIETTSARNYVFTESHCVLVGENPKDPNVDYTLVLLFQWQSGEIVPVYPNKIMEEAGATYTFPDWPGPWD